MAFKDWQEFGADALALPYHGTVYVLPEVSMDLGARLTVELADPDSDFNQLPVQEMWRALFGADLYDRLRADGVPVRVVSRMFITALADFQFGRAAAEATWEAGLDPKALAERMLHEAMLTQETVAAALVTPSPSTDEATTTR